MYVHVYIYICMHAYIGPTYSLHNVDMYVFVCVYVYMYIMCLCMCIYQIRTILLFDDIGLLYFGVQYGHWTSIKM